MQIEGKTALVTGGVNGIGYCTVRELLRHGAKAVAILDVDSNGESVVAELQNEFGKKRAVFYVCDVASNEDVKESFKKAINAFGTLDIVINNAGVMDDAGWQPMVDVNYKGVVRCTLTALSYMGRNKGGKGGTIVNMASVVGIQPNLIAPIYGGTHHAIVGFSLSLQYFYDKTGVRVMVICPGLTDTALSSKFMASKEHAIDLLDDEMAAKEMVLFQQQSPEHVANAIIELLEKGSNGTVFVSENNQPPFAVEMPHYSTRKITV